MLNKSRMSIEVERKSAAGGFHIQTWSIMPTTDPQKVIAMKIMTSQPASSLVRPIWHPSISYCKHGCGRNTNTNLDMHMYGYMHAHARHPIQLPAAYLEMFQTNLEMFQTKENLPDSKTDVLLAAGRVNWRGVSCVHGSPSCEASAYVYRIYVADGAYGFEL